MEDKALQRMQRDLLRLLTQIVQREVDDPELQWITITQVELPRGSREARVFVHAPKGSIEDAESCVRRLNRMAPHFHQALRRARKHRRVPQLRFVWDEAMERGIALMGALRNARQP